MRFKISWASLNLKKKFIVFLCITLYLRAISKYKPGGGGGGGGLHLEGLIFVILRYFINKVMQQLTF